MPAANTILRRVMEIRNEPLNHHPFALRTDAWFAHIRLPYRIAANHGNVFLAWTQSVRQAVPNEIVAMDGKALRRALDQDQNAKVIVSAWAEDNGLVLGQWKVDDKSNEITAVPQLLRALELSCCIVTLDAMGCQKEIAREIKEADADYVLALKGNQETVHREVKEFLDDAVAEGKTWKAPGALPRAAAEPLPSKKTVEKEFRCVRPARSSWIVA